MVNLEALNIETLTKEDLLSLSNSPPKGKFTDFVVVPTGGIHDSGFECMKFILLNRGTVVGVVSGCSDVIHLNGIGGFGRTGSYTGNQKPISWHIDCLPSSGCLRFWCNKKLSTDEFVGSDFCVYVED